GRNCPVWTGRRTSAVQLLRAGDLDAEAAQAHVGSLRGGEQFDRGDAEVLQDLRTEADLAPLPRARGFRACVAVRDFRDRHAGGAVAQIDDDALTGRLEMFERRLDRLRAAEHVSDHVGAMQTRGY